MVSFNPGGFSGFRNSNFSDIRPQAANIGAGLSGASKTNLATIQGLDLLNNSGGITDVMGSLRGLITSMSGASASGASARASRADDQDNDNSGDSGNAGDAGNNIRDAIKNALQESGLGNIGQMIRSALEDAGIDLADIGNTIREKIQEAVANARDNTDNDNNSGNAGDAGNDDNEADGDAIRARVRAALDDAGVGELSNLGDKIRSEVRQHLADAGIGND